MTLRSWITCLAGAGLLLGGTALTQAEEAKSEAGTLLFGALQTQDVDKARQQAQDWLKSVGKTDADTQKAFATIWASERPVLNRVADTLALGDPQAAKLLAEARDPYAPAPMEVPSLLRDTKQPMFYRANLTLAYAKCLSQRRVYEEALDALQTIQPEQVVDPGAFFFHKSVAEYSMLKKDDATQSIVRLLDDVTDAPDRYKLVASLMYLDMQQWKAKDLGEIARKMDNIERRLELARGGPQTQKMQKDVVARLDELIKQLENQQNQNQNSSSPNGGGCPNGGPPQQGNGSQPGNTNQPSSPQQDSIGGGSSGQGEIDEKTLKQLAEVWGKLPEGERTRAMMELTRNMPPRYREVIENYFKKLAQAQP
ncbi:MAG: hypothetical protein ACK4RK_13665 [Gemmataceae bacterium]